MNTINWIHYDDKEFTNFCNALLSFEVSKKVKPFSAPGRDGGIDASYTGEYDGQKGDWRFQFKFYQVARKQGFNQLKSAIKSEIKKITNDDFFVLMTNVELLPQEVSELESIFELKKSDNSVNTKLLVWEGAKLQTLFLRHPLLSMWMNEGFETAQLQDYTVFFKKNLAAENFVPYTLANEFIGRDNKFSELLDFINSDKKIVLIEGEAGVGKTRLIVEFFKRRVDDLGKWKPLVLATKNINFDRIRNLLCLEGDFIILVDDAHSYDSIDIADLKKLADLSKGDVKLVLTARSLEASKSLQEIREFDQDDVFKMNISNLDRSETQDAFKPYIEGGHYWHHIRELINISYGRPVLIVAILRAIFENTRIETIRHDNFLKTYVSNYFDEFHLEFTKTTNISDFRSRRLLENIAFIEPFSFEDNNIARKLSEIHGIPQSEITYAFKLLKDHSFVSGKYEQSIKPDYYSDIILQNIDVSEASNYIEEFVPQLDNIIINLASVDEVDDKKGLLLNDILNRYIDLIAFIEDPEKRIEEKQSIISGILSTVSQIVYIKPDIAERAVELYLASIVKNDHPVKIDFDDNSKYRNSFTETFQAKIITILSRLLFLPQSYGFVYNKSFKLYELTKDKKIFTIYNFSKRDIVEKFKLSRQIYALTKLRQKSDINVINYVLIREILKAMLTLDFTIYEPSPIDRNSTSITTYNVPARENVKKFRLEVMDLLIYYYELSAISESKLETLKLILDSVRGIFASRRGNNHYQNGAEIIKVLDFTETHGEGFGLLEQREVLDKFFWFVKWGIGEEFISQINRIRDKLKPKDLTQRLSQLFSSSEVSLLKNPNIHNFITEQCDLIANSSSKEELAIAMKAFLEPQPFTPHHFWEFLRNLEQKHTAHAIYFHDYLFEIGSPLYYQYASGVLTAIHREKNLQQDYWTRIRNLEGLDTWEADNVILNNYGNNVPGMTEFHEDDIDVILKIFDKGRSENNHGLASGLQTVIAFNHPRVGEVVHNYLHRAHQREAEMFFIWLSDNKTVKQEFYKNLIFESTARFYLSHELERILIIVLEYYGVQTVFEYLVKRFNYKKELVIETKSLMGYEFVPPGEHSSLFEDNPTKAMEMFEMALDWYMQIDGTGGHLYYARDMLEYLQPHEGITDEIYVVYNNLINKYKSRLDILDRIAASFSIFHLKDSQLVALIVKIYDMAFIFKEQEAELFHQTYYSLYDSLTTFGVKTGVPGQPFQVDVDLSNLLQLEIKGMPDYLESKTFLSEVLKNINNQIDQDLDHDNETW
jgi:hypothetical protein